MIKEVTKKKKEGGGSSSSSRPVAKKMKIRLISVNRKNTNASMVHYVWVGEVRIAAIE